MNGSLGLVHGLADGLAHGLVQGVALGLGRRDAADSTDGPPQAADDDKESPHGTPQVEPGRLAHTLGCRLGLALGRRLGHAIGSRLGLALALALGLGFSLRLGSHFGLGLEPVRLGLGHSMHHQFMLAL